MSGGLKRGMTLVELLVVLVILAGLATSVAVSSSGMLDRARTERAVRQGEAMRDALTRPEGLNLAFDMGRMPDPAQPGELSLLVSRNFMYNAQRIDSLSAGPLDVESNGTLRRMPLFRQYDIATLANSVTGTSLAAEFKAFTNGLNAAGSRYKSMTIGAGWRGPYCTAVAHDENGLLPDPFGGYWDISAAGGMTRLVCYGQDRLSDVDVSADTNDWRSADIVVPVCPAQAAVSLHVEARQSSPDAAAVGVLVHCIAPRLDANLFETDSDGVPCCKIVGQYACAAKKTLSVTAAGDSVDMSQEDGLTPGTWAVFLCATNGPNSMRAGRTVELRPGRNMVRFQID